MRTLSLTLWAVWRTPLSLLRQILNKMHRRSIPFVLGVFFASLLASGAQEVVDEVKIIELREAISKLVDVQTLESKERNDWVAKKASFGALLELHQRELKLLDEELAKAGKTAPAHETQTADLESEIQALKQARQLTAEAIARNLPRLSTLAQQFPKPLLVDVEADLASLKAHGPQDEPRDALQSMLAVLAKAEQFNRRFTRSTEVQDGSEVQVLYLGLAQAYYMDRKADGKGKAGVGRPSAEGWTWKSQAEIREALQAAFEIMDKKRQPATVTLPLTLD